MRPWRGQAAARQASKTSVRCGVEITGLFSVALSRLKDEFVSNLSHELRTPLNAVIGFSQLIDSSQELAHSPQQVKYLHKIIESGEHLLGLVQTMLDFAKTASRKMQFEPITLNVRGALQEVAEMLEPKRLAEDVSIEVEVAAGLDVVFNDPLRLRQMLLNLAGNAVKFSKPGGVVKLLALALALDDNHWQVEVHDHGIGISPENLSKLFVPFVQLSAGATKVYGGTGLGLALVRKRPRNSPGRNCNPSICLAATGRQAVSSDAAATHPRGWPDAWAVAPAHP